jgi:hypothetical protein
MIDQISPELSRPEQRNSEPRSADVEPANCPQSACRIPSRPFQLSMPSPGTDALEPVLAGRSDQTVVTVARIGQAFCLRGAGGQGGALRSLPETCGLPQFSPGRFSSLYPTGHNTCGVHTRCSAMVSTFIVESGRIRQCVELPPRRRQRAVR